MPRGPINTKAGLGSGDKPAQAAHEIKAAAAAVDQSGYSDVLVLESTGIPRDGAIYRRHPE